MISLGREPQDSAQTKIGKPRRGDRKKHALQHLSRLRRSAPSIRGCERHSEFRIHGVWVVGKSEIRNPKSEFPEGWAGGIYAARAERGWGIQYREGINPSPTIPGPVLGVGEQAETQNS